MEVVILPSADDVGNLVADAIQSLVASKSTAVLGVATGSSPLPAYAALVERCRRGSLSFAHARAFLLDKYIGFLSGHPRFSLTFMGEHLSAFVDFADAAVRGPE